MEGQSRPPVAGGVILGGNGTGAVSASDTEAMLNRAGARLGLICPNCGMTIAEDTGATEYVTLRLDTRDGEVGVAVDKDIVCHAESCAELRAELDGLATAKRSFRPWTVLHATEGAAGESAP